ncbi:hypothetical protein ANO14919_097310 [Xylariales sp. No.14919]|nr:hypothetical protein ANO14919_097310 [Xylariales sp. No.14919]
MLKVVKNATTAVVQKVANSSTFFLSFPNLNF